MSHDIEGTTLPHTVSRLVGSALQPLIVHVPGADRAALEDLLELQGSCAYVALFDENNPGGTSSYVGMTTCGQNRPRVGTHLSGASSIYVIADAGNQLTEHDAQVLERFLFAKVTEIGGWQMRCGRPYARGVGHERFADLMFFGSQVMVQLQGFGLFADQAARHLATVPRQFEPIIYNLFRGPPQGEKMVLKASGAEATGVDMGEEGFVICAGSLIRAQVVASASGLNAARREELYFNGQLLRLDDEHFIARRDLWRPSPTSAARFVTGSSASAGDWRPVAPRLRLVRP